MPPGDNVDRRLTANSSPSVSSEDADTIISTALAGLTIDERDRIYSEIHGVDEPVSRSESYTDSKISELHSELHRLAWIEKLPAAAAFRKAEEKNSQFVYHRVFCERFLLGNDFDAQTTARAIFQHYEWKLDLWGENRLTKEIVMDDLEDDDVVVLKKGIIQILPERDRAGRPIVVIIITGEEWPAAVCLGRVLWYTFTQHLVQPTEKMAVGVFIYLGLPRLTKSLWSIHRKLPCFPAKLAAHHHCISDSTASRFKEFLCRLLSAQGSETRAKTKVHTGSPTERNYALMTYGIPQHLIPVSDDGKIKTKHHLEMLQGRRTRDRHYKSGNFNITLIPLPSDILLGRGKPLQQVAGNLRLTAIVDTFVLEYHNLATKPEKTALAMKVVQLIKTKGRGRFLIKEHGVWLEVPDETAREKVSGLLRTLYRTRYSTAKKLAIEANSAGASTVKEEGVILEADDDDDDEEEEDQVEADEVLSSCDGSAASSHDAVPSHSLAVGLGSKRKREEK